MTNPEQHTTPRRRRTPRPATVAGAVLLAGAVVAFSAARQGPPAALLMGVMRLVHSQFVDTLDVGMLHERAAKGLVRQLGDPYSELLSPKDLAAFSMNTLGQYGGVGMEVLDVGDSVFVMEVMPNTPSASAGLRRGDRLLKVNGAPVAGLPLDTVVGRLRGVPGTTARVEVERRGEPVPIIALLRRAQVQRPAVPFTWVHDGVAYVPLPQVSGAAGRGVEESLAQAVRQGARGLVLDLRGNPGGSVDEAVRVLGTLLPDGAAALAIRERTGTTMLRTDGDRTPYDFPVAVLQNGGSASAAEIITGALQDHDRGIVVGTTSFGKGLAQSVFPLDGGWALKLTTSRWMTPVGRSIHRDRTAGDSARRGTDVSTLGGPTMKRMMTFGGRALLDSGGIVPDVRITADTLTDAERRLVRQLGAMPEPALDGMQRLTLRLGVTVRATGDTAFALQPAWRDSLLRVLRAGGATVDDTTWQAGMRYVDRVLETRIANFAFGRAIADRRALLHDRQFLLADSLVRSARSARELVFRAAPKPVVAPEGASRG